MADSIITKAQETRLSQYFDDMVARAESAAPTLGDDTDIKTYQKAKQAYEHNPMFGLVHAAQTERDEVLGQMLAKSTTPEEVKKAENKAYELYDNRIAEMKERFKAGARAGRPDENAAQQQEGALSSLINGDFIGAIKQFVMSIPFVGDMIAGALKSLRSQFGDGEKLSIGEGIERVKLDRALEGAGLNIGLDGSEIGVLHAGGIDAVKADTYTPSTRPPRVSLESVTPKEGLTAEANPDRGFEAPSGTDVPGVITGGGLDFPSRPRSRR